MSEVSEYGSDDLRWMPGRDHTGKIVGKFGVPEELVNGHLRHVDGWTVVWTTVGVELNGRVGTSSLPAVLLSVPDYPSPDAVTWMVTAADAKRLAGQIMRYAHEAERAARKLGRPEPQLDRQTERRIERAVAREIECSEEGCSKQRHVFDENGRGYCKRHAEARGIRPKGKIT